MKQTMTGWMQNVEEQRQQRDLSVEKENVKTVPPEQFPFKSHHNSF